VGARASAGPERRGRGLLGNIDLFVAVSLGFGLVWPPAWAFLLLTKVTPAVVLLWFVVRREWRNLGLVALTALLVALPSLIATPQLWVEWVRVSTQYAGGAYGASTIPVLPRVVLAALVVTLGAKRGWVWTIAIAGTLAMPGLDWKTTVVLLSALPLMGLGLRRDWPLRRGPDSPR